MNKNIILENQSQEIIRINESLEKRVEERTQQLKDVNIKLQSLLDEITESKSDALKAMIKTQEDERSRFAKDLHDGAGQYLAFLKFNLYNISKKIPENQQDLKELLNEQIKLSDNIVKELRHFAYSLMPPVLERIGLKAAIEELLENYKASSKIKIEYYLQDKTKPLPKYYKIHLYRVVQEVVSNAFKHSDCSKISLQMLSYPNNLLIIIEDNGRGFNSKSDFKGMGLKNLISRIAIINGKIDIDSQLNHGTTITIEVPN
jgi:signal transduction histidine kinase